MRGDGCEYLGRQLSEEEDFHLGDTNIYKLDDIKEPCEEIIRDMVLKNKSKGDTTTLNCGLFGPRGLAPPIEVVYSNANLTHMRL